jgi:hypothetical protein
VTSDEGSDRTTYPIVYRDRMAALAGPERCHLLVDDLDERQRGS